MGSFGALNDIGIVLFDLRLSIISRKSRVKDANKEKFLFKKESLVNVNIRR